MSLPYIQLGFFITLITLAFVGTLWIFLPFFGPLLLAGVFATIFYPVHKRLRNRFGKWVSFTALVSTVAILVVIIVPLVFFGSLIVAEATDMYRDILSNGQGSNIVQRAIDGVENIVTSFGPLSNFSFSEFVQPEDIKEYILSGLTWIQTHIGTIFSGIVEYIIFSFIFVLALFFFLRDGEMFIEKIIEFSPLKDTFDKKIVDRIGIAINSVIRGEVVIAIVQGILTGTGFWIFNIPNPALWGFIAAIAALIPTVGTAAIIAPAVIYLFYLGAWIPAVGLWAWGSVLVGLVDNVLRPFIIDRGMNIHPLLILLAVLGGIHVLGPLGFIAGPVILAFLFGLLDIYPMIITKVGKNV